MASTPLRMMKLGGVLDVPIIMLGTMTWGIQNTEVEAFEQMDYAMTRGCNFWDTAELYPVPPGPATSGQTETIIGNWLADRKCRDKVILATKVAGAIPSAPGAAGTRSFVVDQRHITLGLPTPVEPFQPDLTPAQIRMALTASLKRLQTDYVDLYQLHWPSRYVPLFGKRTYHPASERDCVSFEEQVVVMGELIKEGKIRHWGLSNETSYGVVQFCEIAKRLGVPPPISIQNDYSLMYRHYDNELAETCSARNCNVGLLAYGTLAGGTLTGKLVDGKFPPGSRHASFPEFQARYHGAAAIAASAEYAAIAKSKDMSLVTLATAYCTGRPFMGSVIVGATSVTQLKETLDAAEVVLDTDTITAIDAVHLRLRNPIASD